MKKGQEKRFYTNILYANKIKDEMFFVIRAYARFPK